MATRSDTFRVVFEVQNDGTIKAAFADVGKEAQNAGEAVDRAGDRWEALGARIGNSLKVAGGLAAAGLAVVIRNTIQAEQELAQLDAILRSTGNAAGFSRDQLVSMANQLSQSSIFSGGEIIEAQTRLLSYSGIIGENIPRAMQAVIDQSTRLGISVSQSAEIIGRALESPSKAAAALAQQGFGAAFTEEVRESIKALEEQGRAADAQRMILEILEESYGGAAQAARDTFGGALTALKNTLMDITTGGDGSLDGTTQAINDLIDTLNDPAVRQGFADIVDGILSVMGQAAAAIPMLVQFNAELSKAYGIGTQQGQTRAGNIGDFLAGNRDFWASALRGEFNAGANARIRAGFAGGQIANFSNVSTADPRNALADFSNVSTADPRDARRVTGGGGGKDKAAKLSDEERALRQLQERYQRYLQQLQQENELHGDNSELARVNYEIKRDGLDKVNPALAELLRQEAAHADLLGEIEEHERVAADAREEHEEAIRRQQEAYDELIGSLRTELELMGMNRVEANALLAIRRLGISETSKEADEIRGLYQAIEDNERVIGALDAVRSAGSDVLVDIGTGENPFDALADSADRLHARLLQMIADNLMERLLGDFGSTGQGSAGGGWLGNLFGMVFGGGSSSTAGTAATGAIAGGGGWASVIGAVLGGGRAYGGDTRPNMLHEINELGAPEVFRTRNGKQYLLTGSEAGHVSPLSEGGGNSLVVNQVVRIEGRPDSRTPDQIARATLGAATRAQSRYS